MTRCDVTDCGALSLFVVTRRSGRRALKSAIRRLGKFRQDPFGILRLGIHREHGLAIRFGQIVFSLVSVETCALQDGLFAGSRRNRTVEFFDRQLRIAAGKRLLSLQPKLGRFLQRVARASCENRKRRSAETDRYCRQEGIQGLAPTRFNEVA